MHVFIFIISLRKYNQIIQQIRKILLYHKICLSYLKKQIKGLNQGKRPTNIKKNKVMTEVKKNGIGTAGFILALLGLVLCWVPVLNWILWLLGLIFSFVGVFKQPKGLSIAGLIVSCIGIIIIMVVFGAVAALA